MEDQTITQVAQSVKSLCAIVSKSQPNFVALCATRSLAEKAKERLDSTFYDSEEFSIIETILITSEKELDFLPG